MTRDEARAKLAADHPDGLVNLRAAALRARLLGASRIVSAYAVADRPGDRRRTAAFARLAIAAGLAGEPRVVDPTIGAQLDMDVDAIVDAIPAVPFDAVAAWDGAFRFDVRSTHWPYIRAWDEDGFREPVGRIKALLQDAGVRWYLYDAWAERYVSGDRFEESIRGPYTAEELPAAFAGYGVEPGQTLRERRGVAARTDRLDAHVATRVFQARLDDAMARNLQWGLEKLGLLDEGEAQLLPAHLGVPSPFRSPDRSAPEDWPANLERLVDHSHGEIARAADRLRAIEKLRRGIERMHGWDAFLLAYRNEVAQELHAEDAGEDAGD